MASQTGPQAIHVREADLGKGSSAVLRQVDLHVRQGERVLVLGDNGAGKSTLLDTLAGLVPAKRGTIRVLDLDPVAARQALHARIGHLGHTDPFYPELTGRENLAFHAALRELAATRMQEALEASGLGADAERQVARYSRGMRRRLGLAKAFLGAPELLLLDEPDAGLDGAARRVLASRLAAAALTALVVTHHPEDYATWATRRISIEDGRLIDVHGGNP